MQKPASASVSVVSGSALFPLTIHTISEMNWRGHWAIRRKRFDAHKKAVQIAMSVIDRSTWAPPYQVTMVRCSAGTLDDDNLTSSLKAVRDAVANELGYDDGGKEISWVYKQEKAPRKTRKVWVEIQYRVSGGASS